MGRLGMVKDSQKMRVNKHNEIEKQTLMKAPRILLAGLLALSAAGVAQAQTITLHLTGSTAFRTAVQNAMMHILQPGYTAAFVGSSFTGAGEAIITGTTISNINGSPAVVTIKTYWSGSLAGIQAVSTQLPLANFLANSNSTSGGTTTALSNPGFDAADVPEVCMSDGFQNTSQFAPPQYAALTHQNVGVVDFDFVKNLNAPAGLTNMTPLQAQALWVNGYMPLSLWTGNPSDATNLICATGRNPDSGTRKTAFLETGIQNPWFNTSRSARMAWSPGQTKLPSRVWWPGPNQRWTEFHLEQATAVIAAAATWPRPWGRHPSPIWWPI